MKVFEFYFNPKAHKDRFFKTFSFEPEKLRDRRLGNLSIAGELANALPVNAALLEKLALVIHDAYYARPSSGQHETHARESGEHGHRIPVQQGFSPERNLKAALRKANQFLSQEVKNGNVDWIGNLHIAVLLFAHAKGEDTFHFTKAGRIKIFMARHGAMSDIGKNIERQQGDSSKVFGNVASGKIVLQDQVVTLTQDLFELFSQHNLLNDLAFFKDAKQYEQLFHTKKKELSKVSGLLFSILVEEREEPQKSRGTARKAPWASFSQITLPSILKVPQFSLPSGIGRYLKKWKIYPFPAQLSAFVAKFPVKKNALRVMFLGLLLFAGFLFFQDYQTDKARGAKEALALGQSFYSKAQDAVRLKNEAGATTLFQNALAVIQPHLGLGTPSDPALLKLQKDIETDLATLHRIELIEAPALFHEIPSKEAFVPQALFLAKDQLYAFDPSAPQLYRTGIKSPGGEFLAAPEERKFQYGAESALGPVFFTSPNLISALMENNSWQESSLPSLNQDFQFTALEVFADNLYFLEPAKGEIVKYANPFSPETLGGLWLARASQKKPLGAKGIAIDGNIWVVAQNNEIQKYTKGLYQGSLKIAIYPSLENISKLKTGRNPPFLYVLDAPQQRLIVFDKSGKAVKQYQSPAFDNLLDFAVSRGGDTLYVLNGNKIYRIAVASAP